MYDEATDFYYLRSRYYDPEVGRFLNADGLVSTGRGIDGFNMYAYCDNNPVMFVDPNGDCLFLIPFIPLIIYIIKKLVEYCEKKVSINQSKPELTPAQKEQQLIVAQTIYGEEDGRLSQEYDDWQEGQSAVAAIILNRQNAQISYLGCDLKTICTMSGQFDGYYRGAKMYASQECDSEAWDHAMYLAECVVRGDYEGLNVPNGITNKHLYFNKSSTFQNNISANGGKFYFGGNTTLVTPLEAVQYGGNTFFYY